MIRGDGLRRLARAGVGVAVALSCAQAFAMGNDSVFLRAQASAQYDSNVFRVSDDARGAFATRGGGKSDVILGVGAGLRCDLPVSRQRFSLDAAVTQYTYNEFSNLDYTGFALSGQWNWQVGSRWSGRVAGGVREDRQSYSSAVGGFEPSLLRSSDLALGADYALTPRWTIESQAALYRYAYDTAALQADDFETDSVALGVRYKSPLGNGTGLRFREERGRWPNRAAFPAATFDNAYTQRTLSLVVDWGAGGRSRLSGEAGYTWRSQDGPADDRFTGPSGRINLDYALSGKSALRASVYQTRGVVEDRTATYSRATGIDLNYSYAMTAKIVTRLSYSHRTLAYEGSTVLVNALDRRDTLNTVEASLRYAFSRTLSVEAGAQFETRDSNVPLGDYERQILYVSGRIEF